MCHRYFGQTAERILDVVSPAETTLAVYYYTKDDEQRELDDFLTNSLAATLADSGSVTVLSRLAMQRIMGEYIYSRTDLADIDGQVAVGEQLHADLLVTGFVTPLGSEFELTTQVLDVRSGKTLDRIVLPFGLPATLELPTNVNTQPQYDTIVGFTTETVIYEDFESGYSDMPVSHEEEHWGDRILSTSGKTSRGHDNTGSFAKYEFTARFDHVDMLDNWEDTDAGFYLRIDTFISPGDADGLAFTVETENYSALYLTLRQFSTDDPETFSIRLQTTPGESRNFKIPFGLFMPGEENFSFDRQNYFQIEFYVSFEENYTQFQFRDGTEIAGALHVDNIGLFFRTSPTSDHLIENFESEIDRMVFTAEIYGSSLYQDYETHDAGVPTINPLVTGQTVTLSRKTGGPAGTYFSSLAEIKSSKDIARSVPMQFLFWVSLAADFPQYDTLTFYVRSSLAESGYIEIQDYFHDGYHAADFAVSESWERVRIDLAAIGVYGNSTPGENVILYISFDLPPDLLADRLDGGVIPIEISFDDFLLENW